ncbi:hypothetical protein [Hymenobacter convexus]|uniref:hypothetical protein n=1 Tax=Hymenobacter sp. CA1UV-4 TaxID=3063782 RepID=UPI0027138A2D|nr:hypothetical protein [Hymenobacter sp. CA1UV-4]MDO7852296.1 hypothetical protein [Hymenobacter sp. CA1UV-4]
MFTTHAPKLLVLLLALLITGGILAAKAPAEPKQYEYVSIIYQDGQLYVTTGAEKFEISEAKPNGKTSVRNLTPVLGKIASLEAQGYELVENTLAYPAYSYTLLRKLK